MKHEFQHHQVQLYALLCGLTFVLMTTGSRAEEVEFMGTNLWPRNFLVDDLPVVPPRHIEPISDAKVLPVQHAASANTWSMTEDGNIRPVMDESTDLPDSSADDAAPAAVPAEPPAYYAGEGPGRCDPCIEPCCLPPLFWFAGVEATFFSPDLNSGFASYRVIDVGPGLDETVSTYDESVDGFYMSPRLWLGIQHGCWGVVGRYWHLQACEGGFDPYWFDPEFIHHPGMDDVGYTISNSLEAYTVDLEVTRAFCCCNWKNMMSFGARYGLLSNSASISSTALLEDGLITGYARANRQAYGTGITSSLQGRRPLFCDSCINLFYGLRGSVLWGSSDVSAETGAMEVTSGAAAGSFNGADASLSNTMFIGEVQVGLQWDYRVQCFPADAFFRCAFEYQYWDGGDGYADANSFAGFGPPDNFTGVADYTAVADGVTMNLVGLVIGTGFTW